MAELNTIITLRQGTTAEWAVSTVRLREGEMGLEYLADGSVKVKAGIVGEDGQGKLWADLPYVGGDLQAAKVFQVELAEGDVDDIAAIEAQVALENAEKQDGDVAIVKALIANGKYSYTSYVYESALDVEGNASCGWTAMDGNYSASNVFLKDQITLAGDYGKDSAKHSITTIGNFKIGDVIPAGTSLQEMFMNMLSQRLQPANPTNPSTSITLYIDGATKKTTAGAVEVGTTINPSYTVGFNKGSYTYGPTDTGVTVNSYSVTSTGRKTVDGATETTVEDSATTATGAFTSFVVDDDTSYKLSVSTSHTGGVVALDNLGSASNPVKQIAEGTKTNTSGTVSGYRAWFCGYKNGTNALADASAITGAQVRALGNAANGSWLGSMNVAQMKQMFFAAPAGKGYKPVIKDASTTAPQTVQGPITVSVEGKDGFAAIDYDVWYVANASAASGSATLNITKT